MPTPDEKRERRPGHVDGNNPQDHGGASGDPDKLPDGTMRDTPTEHTPKPAEVDPDEGTEPDGTPVENPSG